MAKIVILANIRILEQRSFIIFKATRIVINFINWSRILLALHNFHFHAKLLKNLVIVAHLINIDAILIAFALLLGIIVEDLLFYFCFYYFHGLIRWLKHVHFFLLPNMERNKTLRFLGFQFDICFASSVPKMTQLALMVLENHQFLLLVRTITLHVFHVIFCKTLKWLLSLNGNVYNVIVWIIRWMQLHPFWGVIVWVIDFVIYI